jgi:hypothetical protein
VLSNGNLALFDNGHYLIPQYSSYVEYEIDEQNFTATLVRRYSRNGTIYSQARGGVAGEPAWVEVQWYYNNAILDNRF